MSYSREDRAWAARLADTLEVFGYTVWWDRKIKYGAEFDSTIEDELTGALAVIVVWSPSAIKSAWVRAEARKAIEMGTYLPLMREHLSLPLPFGGYQTANFSGWEGNHDAEQVHELIEALAGRTGREVVAPAPRPPTQPPPIAPAADLPAPEPAAPPGPESAQAPAPSPSRNSPSTAGSDTSQTAYSEEVAAAVGVGTRLTNYAPFFIASGLIALLALLAVMSNRQSDGGRAPPPSVPADTGAQAPQFAMPAGVGTSNPTVAGGQATPNHPVVAPPLPARPVLPRGPLPFTYILYFDYTKTDIKADQQPVIAEAVRAIQAASPTGCSITGHTDSVEWEDMGPPNDGKAPGFAMSSDRALVVARALIDAGVPADKLHSYAAGVKDQEVPTGPGVRDPQNRRVVIACH